MAVTVLAIVLVAPAALASDRRSWLNNLGLLLAVLAGVLAALALIGAVLVPDEAPDDLRDLLHLGQKGNEAATTPWVRWVLVGLAALLLVLPRIWGRPIWPEVLIAGFISLAIYAGVKQHQDAAEPKGAKPVPMANFVLPAAKVRVAGSGDNGEEPLKAGEVVLVVVEPDKVVRGRPFTYLSKRYKGTTTSALDAGDQENEVRVGIARGAEDADAVTFAADLTGATRIYMLSPQSTKQ